MARQPSRPSIPPTTALLTKFELTVRQLHVNLLAKSLDHFVDAVSAFPVSYAQFLPANRDAECLFSYVVSGPLLCLHDY